MCVPFSLYAIRVDVTRACVGHESARWYERTRGIHRVRTILQFLLRSLTQSHIEPYSCEQILSIGSTYFAPHPRSLSARLYNQTSDAQYLSTALLTLNFIMNHLYTGSVILDNINVASCNQSNVLVTQNSGWVIDGLTTLVAFNDSYLPLWVSRSLSSDTTSDLLPCTI